VNGPVVANINDERVQLLNISAPGGLEKYRRDLADGHDARDLRLGDDRREVRFRGPDIELHRISTAIEYCISQVGEKKLRWPKS